MNTDTTAQVEWMKSAANVATAASASKGFVFYDVERYEEERPSVEVAVPAEPAVAESHVLMTVVNGELFELDAGQPPAELRPLPEGTTLLRLSEAAPQD